MLQDLAQSRKQLFSCIFSFIIFFQTFPFVSDMGGMFGLFIGLSSLSIVHIFEFLIKLCETAGRNPHKTAGTISPRGGSDEKHGTSQNSRSLTSMRHINISLGMREDLEMTPVDTWGRIITILMAVNRFQIVIIWLIRNQTYLDKTWVEHVHCEKPCAQL